MPNRAAQTFSLDEYGANGRRDGGASGADGGTRSALGTVARLERERAKSAKRMERDFERIFLGAPTAANGPNGPNGSNRSNAAEQPAVAAGGVYPVAAPRPTTLRSAPVLSVPPDAGGRGAKGPAWLSAREAEIKGRHDRGFGGAADSTGEAEVGDAGAKAAADNADDLNGTTGGGGVGSGDEDGSGDGGAPAAPYFSVSRSSYINAQNAEAAAARVSAEDVRLALVSCPELLHQATNGCRRPRLLARTARPCLPRNYTTIDTPHKTLSAGGGSGSEGGRGAADAG